MAKTRSNRIMTLKEAKHEIAETARIGQAFLEGDLFNRILQPYAVTYRDGDDLDFNPAAFVPLKKTLMRLHRVSRVKCSTTLWRRRPDMPDRTDPLLYGGVVETPDGDMKPKPGYVPPEMSPPLRKALVDGKTGWKTVRGRRPIFGERGVAQPVSDVADDRVVQHFVPLYDSMGEIAGALEVFAYLEAAKGK